MSPVTSNEISMNQVPNHMNPLFMLALLGGKSDIKDVLPALMMMQDQYGQAEMQNMFPLALFLMRDDSSSRPETQKPSLEPSLQEKIDQINSLAKLITDMGLEKLAPIPSEWNIPANGVSNEIINFLEENPGKHWDSAQYIFRLLHNERSLTVTLRTGPTEPMTTK